MRLSGAAVLEVADFCLHLALVEAFAIDGVDVALRHKGIGVNGIYYAVHLQCLRLTAEYQQHFHLLLRIPSGAFKNRASAVHLGVDCGGYGAPFF